MIKAIVFDFGNVICKFDNALFINSISNYTLLSAQELEKRIYQESDLPQKYETGIISSNEFFKQIVQKCNLSISKGDFIKAYTDIFTPINSTINLIKKLKKNYLIGLISNTSEWDYNYGIKKIDIFPLFDAISMSFKVKVTKPKTEIFEDIINKIRVKYEECIYIDDIKLYVEAAKQIGFKAIHYSSYSKLVRDMKKYKLKGI